MERPVAKACAVEDDLGWFRRHCEVSGSGNHLERLAAIPRVEVLDVCAERLAGADAGRLVVFKCVARSLRHRCLWDGMVEEELPQRLAPLHMSAVREVLGTLIPEHLHPDLDKAVKKGRDAFGPLRGVSQLRLDGWGVSVRNESMLARARLQEEALEFFVHLLKKLRSVLGWPVLVASKTVGKVVGIPESTKWFMSVAQGWR